MDNPTLEPNNNSSYNDISKVYNTLHTFEQLQKLRIIAQNLRVKKSDKLLDVGCGTGLSVRIFNCNIVGIDKSDGMIKIAEEETPGFINPGQSVEWIVGNAEELPFEKEHFDKVICVTAIHNFENPKKALGEIKRVVKKSKKPNIAITLLKKSKKLEELKKLIEENFKVHKIIIEDKDIIYFLTKH